MARRNYLERKARGTAPGYHRNKRLKSKYGLTPEDFDRMLESQGGVCAICGDARWDAARNPEMPSVDHDHATGKVRGLLCKHCNLILGYARDEPAVLAKAIEYLDSHKGGGQSPCQS
jgi:hypothetical protein